MSDNSATQSISASSTQADVHNYDSSEGTGLDWIKIRSTLIDIITHVETICHVNGKSYLDIIYEARTCDPSERPQQLQQLLDNDHALNGLLTIVQEAADQNTDPDAESLHLMTWKARFLLLKLLATRMRCDADPYDTSLPFAADLDFNVRIRTITTWIQAELVLVLTDLDTLLPGMRYDEIYTLSGPVPSLSTIGSPLSLSSLHAYRPPGFLNSLDDRDHAIRCPLCLDPYSPSDPPLQLSCSHIVGQTCMKTWLESSNVCATSCPHCKAVLCEPRKRTLASPTPEQEERATMLRVRRDKIVIIATTTLKTVMGAFGMVRAQKAAAGLVCEVNKELARNGVQFQLLSQYSEKLSKLVIGLRRW